MACYMGYQQMACQGWQSLCHSFPARKKAAKPWRGLAAYKKLMQRLIRPARYCSGGLPTELGFTERMKVMIFHS